MNKTWFSFLTLIALFVGGQKVMGQKLFTLEELNFGGKNYRKFVPENRYTTWWGDELIRTEASQCSVIDKKTGKESILFTLEEINKYATSDGSSQVKNLFGASFPYPDKSLVLLRSGANMCLYNWKTKKTAWCISTADQGEIAEWNAKSKATSYIGPKSQQLHIRTSDGNDTQLTTDGSREIVYGQSVHRDEFGIHNGMFWAPNGQKLAFYRMDQSMVADYPQVNIFGRIAKCEPDKYPMAGETSHKVTVMVYDLATKKTVTLQAGDPT
ncbi:MAG: DPP IV N-terminal domain-containing protein, partial [Hoylesella buccalis]